MRDRCQLDRSVWREYLLTMIVACFAGCGVNEESYQPNRLLTARLENELQVDLDTIEHQVQRGLEAWFGSLDRPRWPEVLASSPQWKALVDEHALDRAAGPVQRDGQLIERGLYRKHCAQCHGITGDGLGPAAALLNPYARDFRRGTFKFKSTAQSVKPTLDDLVRTIERGIPGTSMPSMAKLVHASHYDNDIPILASYVRYLSIRGEVERRLMLEVVPNIDIENNESLFDPQLKETNPGEFAKQQSNIEQIVLRVAQSWLEAKPSDIVRVQAAKKVMDDRQLPADRQDFLLSARKGKILFQSEIAACAQCHGTEGDGRGKIVDFDEWTKDWTIRAGIDPKNKDQWKPMKQLGLLKPVPIPARNLHLGVFRAGDSSDAIYRSIVNGIDGTPMPAVARLPMVKNGLSDAQIWDLVHYCQALASEDDRRSLEVLLD